MISNSLFRPATVDKSPSILHLLGQLTVGTTKNFNKLEFWPLNIGFGIVNLLMDIGEFIGDLYDQLIKLFL